MLNNDYYNNIYGFINQGIIVFDKKDKKVEYINKEALTRLSLNKENIDYELCKTLEGMYLEKSEMIKDHQEKIVFTILNDNQSKELLRKGPMVIFTWMNKTNWPTSYVSENVKRILGYTVEDFTKGHIFYSDIIHEDDLERVSKEVENAINKDKEFFYHKPYRLICKDGTLIWISDFTVLIKNNLNEIIGFHGYINNINELMKVRNALVEEEERSKEIIDAADLGTWEWDYETGEIIHNDKWFEMLGYKPENYKDINLNNIVSHPEDLRSAHIELEKHIKGEKPYYQIERRIKRNDNSYAWILDRGRIIKYTKNNTPKKIFGVHVDISQQKIIEERFKLFMDSAEEIFIILNDELKIVEINKTALSLISEFELKEKVIGKSIHDVLPFLSDEIYNYFSIIEKGHQMTKIEKHINNDKNEFYEFSLFKINNDIGLIGRNITSTIVYQNSIEQMNENFNKILSTLAFGVVIVSMDRKVKWANDQALKLFGIDDLNEIEGKYCKDFICINNKTRECPLNGTPNYNTIECKIRNKNNQLIEVMKKVTIIDYENEKVVLESFVDISERKVMERKLEKETERLKNIYRIANIGVFDFDFVKNILYMNKNQYKIIDVPIETPKEELIEIIESRIGKENFEKVLNIPKDGKFSLELELNTPSKKKYVKIYGSTKSKFEDRFNRIIGACIDITNLKEAENKALQASQSKSAFLANMSHEIRTPLNGILGFTEALLETEMNPKQVDYLHTIKNSGISLTEIIEDILNLSKIEAGKMVLLEEFIDIRKIISEAIDILKLDSYEKEIKLLYNIDLDESSQFKLDSVRLKQVIINLLGNAIKFTDRGFVHLNIRLNDDKKSIHFEIIDTGIGISVDNQRNIMDSFYQGEPQITRKYGGTGLGLTISNRILNLMGSNLEVSSKLGQGSKFYFDIVTEIKRSSLEFNKVFDTSVLIIDSDSIALESLAKKINGLGCRTYSSTNLTESINVIKKNTSINKIFISSEYQNVDIRDYLDYLEDSNKKYYVYIFSFKLYNKDFIQKKYESVKYEYISRPLSRKTIRNLINENNKIAVKSIKKSIKTNKKVKILIAEDNSINMKLVKTFINSFISNVEIYEAINGLRVMNILEAQNIDLIFMDIQMPIMDGIETTERIRSFNEKIPIIGLTALTEEEDELKCRAVGMNDFIRKPISRQKVFDTLKKWLT